MTRLGAAVLMVMLGACLTAAPASAGGWATVGLGSLPDGTRAGEAWVVDLTVLQHGRTPLEGVHPALTITNASGDVTRRFSATATERPGVYRARVVFPSAGTWRYVVDDDFSARHAFGPVRVGAAKRVSAAVPTAVVTARQGEGDDGAPWSALGAAVGAGLIAAGLAVVLRRRRPGHKPGPA